MGIVICNNASSEFLWFQRKIPDEQDSFSKKDSSLAKINELWWSDHKVTYRLIVSYE